MVPDDEVDVLRTEQMTQSYLSGSSAVLQSALDLSLLGSLAVADDIDLWLDSRKSEPQGQPVGPVASRVFDVLCEG